MDGAGGEREGEGGSVRCLMNESSESIQCCRLEEIDGRIWLDFWFDLCPADGS